jgi:hypothetical protein
LFVVAANQGVAPVRVELETEGLTGFQLVGGISRRVAPGSSQSYELKHVPGEEIRGALKLRSEDARRETWWQRRAWRTKDLRPARHVHLHEERWRLGTETVLFPPGVRRQSVRIWNDSDRERRLDLDAPHGYRLISIGKVAEQHALAVPPQKSADIEVQALGSSNPETQWEALADRPPLSLIRMRDPRPDGGADVVVAIDFGTRNTGVRVRWRRTLVPSKPAGTVDAVGDRGSAARFPTQMVLNVNERGMRWGKDAADYIAASRMTSEEIAVGNLKSALRAGVDRFTPHNPAWTNSELLARYFERLFGRLDEYFRTADPAAPLTREGMQVNYVVCRPVLDANEGDEIGRRYESALRSALARSGVDEKDLRFVHEPVAAAIGIARRRDEALLSLPEGAAIAVVDSGGGTTDVALARVRLQEGRVGLDLAGTYSLRLADENPGIEALEYFGMDDRELGGNVLDWCLAHRLSVRAKDVLETDGKPVPERIFYGTARETGEAGGASTASAAALRNFVLNCRRMKEAFAHSSTQYLNRVPGKGVPGEILPYPTREDLQGVYLVHSRYEERLLRPLLQPIIGTLNERCAAITEPAEGHVRPTEVRRVFYVGGTNIDPFVRMNFSRAFPLAKPEVGGDSQSDERIEERLHAVVEGAVWLDEQLFPSSPLSLALMLRGEEHGLVRAGAAVPPAGVSPPRFFSQVLEPAEELEAGLIASGEGLPASVEVARALYRNETDSAQEVTLAIQISRERGVSAEVRTGETSAPQWRFNLVPDGNGGPA